MAEGDSHFARRAIGAVDGVASRHEIDAAIALYRKGLEIAPLDVEVLARLLRAMQFRGAYTGVEVEEKKLIFEEGRKRGQDAVDRLEENARTAKGMSRIESLRLVKGAPALYLWTLANWGEWGLVKGKFAAARSGIAAKLRDLAQSVIDMDPLYEDAAGYRTLGRLHAEAPKIPLVTGWVSHDKGVQLLRRANQAAPHNPITEFFLAEAILDHESEKRAEAIQLLESSANLTPRPATELEDAHYSAQARKKLQELRAGS